MAKEIMERRASDNEYLHRDFHRALSTGLDYLGDRYGEQAVRDYLRQFARVFYAPLREAVMRQGLVALKKHFERIYTTEGGAVEIELSEDRMTLYTAASPAVTHMRRTGCAVSPYFVETIRTVNEALCEGTGFIAELVAYDETSGGSVQRFMRVAPEE